MKRIVAALLMLCVFLSFPGCDREVGGAGISGKTYCWEREGFGGDFCIVLHEDGTMSYYEGLLSSHLGMGTWTLEKGILTITEGEKTGYAAANRFRVEEDAIVFLAEGSDNFLYLKVTDGDRFFIQESS